MVSGVFVQVRMVCVVSRTGRELQRYDQGRRLVVGCIPYRYKSGSDGSIKDELEVLVISSKKGQGMMFPKVVTTNHLYKIMNFNFTVHNSLPSN